MIAIAKKKPYSKRKSEDYILSRKFKYFTGKLFRFLQFIILGFLIYAIVWTFWFEGKDKISGYINEKTNEFLISAGLAIKSVEIEGNNIVPTNLILEKVLAYLGDVNEKSIVMVDPKGLNKELTSLGWIDSADIQKKLSGIIIIKIIERKPAILWQSNNQIWLADEKGNLLTNKIDQQYLGLPVIVGKNSQKDILEIMEIISSAPEFRPMVTEAIKVGERRWDIMTNKGRKVKLPEEGAIYAWKKLVEFNKKNAIFSKNIKYIDLRIENQIVTAVEKEVISDEAQAIQAFSKEMEQE